MPDREIVVKVTLDGLTDASTQAKGFADDVQGIGTAAGDAASKAEPLGAALDKAGTALAGAGTSGIELSGTLKDKLGPAADAAFTAFDKLSNTQGVRGLSIGIAQAQIAMNAFKSAMDAAAQSGEKLTPGVSAALKAMQADITAATQKLGDLRKAQTDVSASAALAGSQFDALRGRAGSLTSMFQSMEQTGSGLTKTVGEIGLGIGIGVIAFDAAVRAGEAVSKALVGMVNAYSDVDTKQQAAEAKTNLMNIAMNAAAKGQIAYGNSMEETIANYKLMESEQSKSTGLLETLTKALKDIGPAANMQGVAADMTKFGEALHVAFNRGTTDAALFLAAHKGTFKQLEADWANAGQIAPDAILKITESLKQAEAAQKLLTQEGAESVIVSLAKIDTARKLSDDTEVKAAARAQTIFEQRMKNLNQESISSEQYSARKQALYQEMADAETIAADKQAVANATALVEQTKMQASLSLSNDAMKNVVAATGTYETAVRNGVAPNEALASAAGALRLAIEATGAAVPKLSKALLDSLVGPMKVAADQSKAEAEQHDVLATAMKKVEDSATGMGKAISGLNAIFDKFGINLGLTVKKILDLSEAMGAVAQAGA